MNVMQKSMILAIVFSCFGLDAVSYGGGQDLLNAAKKSKTSYFARAMQDAQSRYRGNLAAFFEALNARDKDGYNVLLLFCLTGDMENLSVLLDGLQKYYGSNAKAIFQYLNTRTELGANALILAEYNANRNLIELLLVRAFELIGSDKNLFFEFMNAADHRHGSTALLGAAQDSGSDSLIMMVSIAERVFGEHSDLFYRFINTKDLEGNTALSVSLSPFDKFFLKAHGAYAVGPKKEEAATLQRALYLGNQMINAAKHSEFAEFKSIINQAVEEFKNDKDLLYHFFSTNDDNGWSVLIHTAAEGDYDYVMFILDVFEKNFLSTERELESFLIQHTDFEGRTALHFAIFRRHYRVATLLLDKIITYIKDPAVLLAFLNSPDELSGQTPFIAAVYGSGDYDKLSFDFLKKMLASVAQVFGKSSRLFELFINARDYNGLNALAYVSDDKIRGLLVSCGALDVPMKKIKGIGDLQELEIHGDI